MDNNKHVASSIASINENINKTVAKVDDDIKLIEEHFGGKRVNKDNPLVKPTKKRAKQISMLDNLDPEYGVINEGETITPKTKQYDSDATIQAQDLHLKKHYDKPVRQYDATSMMNAAIEANTNEVPYSVKEDNDLIKRSLEAKEAIPYGGKENAYSFIDKASMAVKEAYDKKVQEDMLDAFAYAIKFKDLKTEDIFESNPVYNRLADRMKQQIRKGVDKYNTPNGVETTDYSIIGWYEHLQEELVDGSTYNEIMLMKINMVIKTLQVASRMNDLSLLKDHVAIALELLEGNGNK